jgi:hypothetical protein
MEYHFVQCHTLSVASARPNVPLCEALESSQGVDNDRPSTISMLIRPFVHGGLLVLRNHVASVTGAVDLASGYNMLSPRPYISLATENGEASVYSRSPGLYACCPLCELAIEVLDTFSTIVATDLTKDSYGTRNAARQKTSHGYTEYCKIADASSITQNQRHILNSIP